MPSSRFCSASPWRPPWSPAARRAIRPCPKGRRTTISKPIRNPPTHRPASSAVEIQIMNPFHHKDGELFAEDVPLRRIADEVGTPCYVYSSAAITERYRRYAESLSGLNARIYYSIKANSNQGVIATLGKLGAGADVVSAGEM